jgi:hypothetical protein
VSASHGSDDGFQQSLAATLFEITAIPSPIGEEKALCDYLAARFARNFSKCPSCCSHAAFANEYSGCVE